MPSAWTLLRQTFAEWNADEVPRRGAALAFYTALSIAPLLVLSLRFLTILFGDEAARNEIERQSRSLIGPQGADAIRSMLESAAGPGDGTWATLISVATLLIGASGVFGELQASLNAIWDAPPRHEGFVTILRDRFLSFAMVMVVAFLLLVSLLFSAGLSFVLDRLQQFPELPETMGAFLPTINALASIVLITIMFALIFKVLPDVRLAWRDVWFGALLTALLFISGKWAIGIYLSRSAMASAYGAAGSFAVLLVWVYYSAQILYFGAELTQVCALNARKDPEREDGTSAGERAATENGPPIA